GLLLATWSLTALKALAIEEFPHLVDVRLDTSVLAFTILVTVGTGLICGLVPALRGGRVNLQESIKEGTRGTMSRSSRRLNNVFVVSQLALSLVLLIGAALLLQSFRNLLAVNPGFKPSHVLMAHLALPEQQYSSKPKIKSFYDALLQQVRALPG